VGRIAQTFKRLRWEKEAALIPYLTVGYPSLEVTRQLVPVMARQGADLIELGVPFSDPIADGATIQRASHAALENGVTLGDCLSVAAEARRANEVPLVLMSYYNPIHKYGIERFAADCEASGVDGVIVPDLPPEEAGELKVACGDNGVDLIFLVAPTSTDERLRRVAEMASGFIYCVSVAGVTGARAEVSEEVADLVARVREHTGLPLVVGFGLSTPEHVAKVSQIAEGAVVASAMINLIERLDAEEMVGGVAEFVRELKEATGKLETRS
jgi:tryptophan synthase alpha chain